MFIRNIFEQINAFFIAGKRAYFPLNTMCMLMRIAYIWISYYAMVFGNIKPR